MKRFPKCPKTRKTAYPEQNLARKGMMHIWSHDPSADLRDLHVYQCEHKMPFAHWHIGHKSFFEMKQARQAEALTQSQSA